VKNYKNDFTEEDIFPNLPEHSSEQLGNELEKNWEEEECSQTETITFQGTVPNVRPKIYGLRCCTTGIRVYCHVSKNLGIS
jgi:hypothetical protein